MADALRIALACCRATPTAQRHDLYPDPDSELLADRFRAQGVEAQLVSWDNEQVDWTGFDAVVLRSTWDDVDRPVEYLQWVHAIDDLTTLHNPAAIVEWNIDKTYLRDLAAVGVPTIPTQWIAPGESWLGETQPSGQFIVKPSIGSGARSTARYAAGSCAAATEHISALGAQGQTVMVQDYFASVEDAGETSITFIAGQATHAVRKGAFLNVDEGVIDTPWERMTFLGRCEPTDTQMAIATNAFAIVQSRCTRIHPGRTLLYGRVDLIDDPSGNPVVIEVELIDPQLSLRDAPESADLLASAIVEL